MEERNRAEIRTEGCDAEVGVRNKGLLDTAGCQFLTLKTFSGTIRKNQSKQFLDMVQQGEYYCPEGCTTFSSENSSSVYIYGGARASKPGHWNMANYLFQIKTEKQQNENNAWDIVSIKMFNQSASKTSQFMKLFGASGITDSCSDIYLKGFVINGKNLDCPSESKFLSNDIQMLETVSQTTFRSIIVRSGDNGIDIDKLKSTEVFQSGDIPAPSYGSSLLRVPNLDSSEMKCAIKIGGAILSNHMSDVEFLFSGKTLWEEESSGEIHVLMYDLESKTFIWKAIKETRFEPRAFHSAVLLGNFIYIFGGLDIKTGHRLGINPLRIDLSDWVITEICVTGLTGVLSGAAIAASSEHIYLVGGYKNQVADEKDKPCDMITQITVEETGGFKDVLSKSMCCGLLGQPTALLLPGEKCLLILGGTLEKFGIVSDGYLASDPCDYPKCELQQNSNVSACRGFSENPNFLGCQGPCKRWFHAYCLGFDYSKYLLLSQRKYWQCNRYDCKKQ